MYKRKKIILSALAALTALPLAACDAEFLKPDTPLPSEMFPLESTGSNVMKEYTGTLKNIPICAHRGIRIISNYMPSLSFADTEKWELPNNDLFLQEETNLDFSSILVGSRMQELVAGTTTLKHFWASDTNISATDPTVETVEREDGTFYNCEVFTLELTVDYPDGYCVLCGEKYSLSRVPGELYMPKNYYRYGRRRRVWTGKYWI